MANATIYSHPVSYLSWSSSSSVTTLTENENTIVTNSSGATVYWTQGGDSGSITNGNAMTCVQGASKKKWSYAETSTGAARITLTIVGSGGG